ncbi:hypothetical protein ABK040_009157 [Willaertia magna]
MLKNVLLKSGFKEGKEYILTHTSSEGSIRNVIPYFYQHYTHVKERMLNKPFIEAYCKDYLMPQDVFLEYISKEYIKLNNQKVIDPFKILNPKDTFQLKEIKEEKIIKHFDSIEIIYEDFNYLIVSKPENVPVHSVGRYHKNTLLYILQNEYSKFNKSILPEGNLYPLHRLDRLTSGVLIIGKTKDATLEFQNHLKNKTIQKQYIAIVEGICEREGVFDINYPLIQIDPVLGIWKAIKEDNHHLAKHALTKCQVLKRDYEKNRSIILCQPITGRTHQIRAHLQSIGHKIIGDLNNTMESNDIIEMKEKAYNAWRYKLNLLNNFNYKDPKIIEKIIQDKILNNNIIIPKSLNLFSFRYNYKNISFECEITIPKWLENDWLEINNILKESELYHLCNKYN